MGGRPRGPARWLQSASASASALSAGRVVRGRSTDDHDRLAALGTSSSPAPRRGCTRRSRPGPQSSVSAAPVGRQRVQHVVAGAAVDDVGVPGRPNRRSSPSSAVDRVVAPCRRGARRALAAVDGIVARAAHTTSSPPPASSRSVPVPPKTMSLPRSPCTTSAPPPARTRSLPARAFTSRRRRTRGSRPRAASRAGGRCRLSRRRIAASAPDASARAPIASDYRHLSLHRRSFRRCDDLHSPPAGLKRRCAGRKLCVGVC